MAPSAYNKEAIIIAVDIGNNSIQLDSDGKTYFEKSIFCASMILKRKLFLESKDDLALILFGSSQTNNPLSTQGSLYDNIEIVSSLGVTTWNLLKYITNVSSTDVKRSDWLSTLVIAINMIKNNNADNMYTKLQIVTFSNFGDNISFDKIDPITRSCLQLGIELTMIGKDLEDISHNPVFEKFISETEATVVNFETVLCDLSYCKLKDVNPRGWKVSLSFGNIFSITVSGYKKIDEVPKAFKWFLCKNYDTADSITELTKQTSYYYVDNGSKIIVDRDDIISGFCFGDTIVPVSDLETNAYGYKSGPKSLQVLGFTEAKNIQRSFLMDGGAYIFVPEENNLVAFNAIFKAMVEREEVMIARKVYQINSMPSVGAMFPQSENDKNYFVFVNLPFAEEENLYKLPSLKSFKPNDEQKNAVCNLINAMDLDDDENESRMPECTYNPELQYVYHCIAQKAINSDKLLTKQVPEHIQNILRPPKQIMENAQQPINEIKKLFSLTSITVDKNVIQNDTLEVKHDEEEEEKIKKPCVISAYSPVEDFNKHLEDGMDSEIVCQKMKQITVELIQSSISLEELKKLVPNLMALRQFYIHHINVGSYNNWMFLVKDSVLLSGKEEMWSQFVDSGIGLITNQEVDDSDVSQEIFEEFKKIETSDDITAEFVMEDDVPLKEFL